MGVEKIANLKQKIWRNLARKFSLLEKIKFSNINLNQIANIKV